jgi:hypothetical protein
MRWCRGHRPRAEADQDGWAQPDQTLDRWPVRQNKVRESWDSRTGLHAQSAPLTPLLVRLRSLPLFQGDVCMQDLGARWSSCRRALLCGDEHFTVLRSRGGLQFAVQILVYAERALVGRGLVVWAEPDNVNIARGGQARRPGKVGDLDVQLGILVGASSVDAHVPARGGNTAVCGHVIGLAARKGPEEEKQNQDGDAIHICLRDFTNWGQAGPRDSAGCVCAPHHQTSEIYASLESALDLDALLLEADAANVR